MELVQALKHYKHVHIPKNTPPSAEDLSKTQVYDTCITLYLLFKGGID